MSKIKRMFPLAYILFMKIAEPRVMRLLHFGAYVTLLIAGLSVMLQPPHAFLEVLTEIQVDIFGAFVAFGGLVCLIAVLPGIWWLERLGLFSLITGMGMYLIVNATLDVPTVTMAIPIAFIFTFVIRWLEIRRYQLAPREE